MCDDVEALVAAMKGRDRACSPIAGSGMGTGDATDVARRRRHGIYQPRHARPAPMSVSGAERRITGASRVSGQRRQSGERNADTTFLREQSVNREAAERASKTVSKGTQASRSKPYFT